MPVFQSADCVQKHFESILRTEKHRRCHHVRMLLHPTFDVRRQYDFRRFDRQKGRRYLDLLLRYSQIRDGRSNFTVDADDLSIERARKSNDLPHSFRCAAYIGRRHTGMEHERSARTKLRSDSTDSSDGPTLRVMSTAMDIQHPIIPDVPDQLPDEIHSA